ncbi:hypothetical protein FHS32_006137 [Streptomyces albaduncus]|uniref:Uncharacterized protein n=1 Tax=Streptomyces griseoloalbus TaxID=67303 RepID=A0A7W8BTI1_9ACTN|nr:hypothetical protein [Streptomyces albaduncus]GGW67284.1 hypothetical protein GCM10010340_51920 [Streptomyces albaduncus]
MAGSTDEGRGTGRTTDGSGGGHGAGRAAHWNESVMDGLASGEPLPAGVIVEPVRADGRVLPAPDDWLRRTRRRTADRSVPLTAGETLTCVGRTGTSPTALPRGRAEERPGTAAALRPLPNGPVRRTARPGAGRA